MWFVGAGPGDPELMTLRGWRVLSSADVVLHDALVNPELLDDLDACLINVGKRCGRHAVPQEETSRLLVNLALEGKQVVRLKGGDPGVLGRVGEEALALCEFGIPFEIVPGVSSATAVPIGAGIPVTHRGLADSFQVATAHRQNGSGPLSIPEYDPKTTLILLMGAATVAEWRAHLLETGYPAELPVAVISAGSTPQQRVLETTVANVESDMKHAALATPVLVVIGWVVTMRARLGSILASPLPLDEPCHSISVAGAGSSTPSTIRDFTSRLDLRSQDRRPGRY